MEASFQKRKIRTAAQEGTSPQWNETLSLEVTTPSGNLSASSLLDGEIGMESLFLNIFDEISIDLVNVTLK